MNALASLSTAEKIELASLLEEKQRRRRRSSLGHYKPYPKQREFHHTRKRERMLMAGNQQGKTLCAANEVAMHVTGRYPDWWQGHRFEGSMVAWVASETMEVSRDAAQRLLFGRATERGTGAIPGDDIIELSPYPNVKDAVAMAKIRRLDGSVAIIIFKSYDQGRRKFQGDSVDLVWFDEEPDISVYTEGLTRTNATGGIVLMTFTPLRGASEVVKRFLDEENDDRATIRMTIEDAEHYTPEQRARIIASYPPHERDARARGIPSLGSGSIYPLAEEDIVCADFPIPDHWPRGFGLDVGWKRTAAVWLAQDPETRTCYVYAEHYRGEAEPAVHAAALRARGEWIPGSIDPAANGRSQRDGTQLIEAYRDLGVDVENALNAVEAGIFKVWNGFSAGMLKIFASCVNVLKERRGYHRDEKGAIVKRDDHAMDAMRYVVMTMRLATKPMDNEDIFEAFAPQAGGWMG